MKPRCYLFFDVDDGLLAISEGRKDLLSADSIKIATKTDTEGQKKYSRIGVVSHRALNVLLEGRAKYGDKSFYQHTISAVQVLNKDLKKDLDPSNIFSTRIAANLAAATGTECFVFSTPDDFSPDAPNDSLIARCGFGFRKIQKPYEDHVIEAQKIDPNKEYVFPEYKSDQEPTSIVSFDNLTVNTEGTNMCADGRFPLTKNIQYLRLAYLAKADAEKEVGPDCPIECHFLDNDPDICDELGSIFMYDLPAVTTLKSFQHNPAKKIIADTDGTPVTCVSSMPRMSNIDEFLKTIEHVDTQSNEQVSEAKPVRSTATLTKMTQRKVQASSATGGSGMFSKSQAKKRALTQPDDDTVPVRPIFMCCPFRS
ncbi:MAG: hypothetical protein ABI597_04000 [Gammaproteobacteria bacterium]